MIRPGVARLCGLVAAIVGVLFPLLGFFAVASPIDGEGASGKVFAAYVYGRPQEINFSLYTHLFHAFVVPGNDGSVKPSGSAPSRELTAEAHKAGVKVVLSLGGWGWDDEYAALASKPEAEARHVKEVMAMVDEYDYDGIDLDWEYPDTGEEVVNFERLCRRFRAELDELGTRKQRPMVLTMAASANPGTLRWLKPEFLVETLDWVNIMTYDYAGDWTDYAGHNAPLFASSKQPGGPARGVEVSMRYLVEEHKVPANHLVLGIPLYGRGFSVGAPYASTRGVTKTRLPRGNYANLERLRREEGWERQWDEETKTPWLVSPEKNAVFGYDDAESVALKTRWGMSQGFRGVFFWEIDQDRLGDGTNPLQEAARREWGAAAAKSP